jgi:hypothetical protein
MRRGTALAGPLLLTAVGLAACSGGSSPAAKPPSPPALSWSSATAAGNGTAAPLKVAPICGSPTDTYLAELLHHSPLKLKVMQEWADVGHVEHQVVVSGTVVDLHQGPGDLPFDHPLGDDLSMDVKLDPRYVPFAQKLGSASSDTPAGDMHVEISSGFIPHVERPPSATDSGTQTWPQLSQHNLTGFQPGFAHPAVGDRVLVAGRYIVDCGHPDFHTELHPISLLAWAETHGRTTVVRFYENPYLDSEYYNPDPTLTGRVGAGGRLALASTKRFPKQLVDEVVGVLTGKIKRLYAYELVTAIPPVSGGFAACASGGGGGSVQVHSDLVVRPGVTVTVSPVAPDGCATVGVAASSSYAAADIPTRTCVMPWPYLDQVTAGALAASVDALQLIERFVPKSLDPVVARSPLVSCADALAGPTVKVAPSGTTTDVDGTQPFPVYGVVTLTRS